MFLTVSEWDLRENWKIHCLLLQWNLGMQVQYDIRVSLSQPTVLSLNRMNIIRVMALTSPLLCKFGVWRKKGASLGGFFAIQNTEKEMPDPFITSRDCVWKQSINTTRFKNVLSVRSNLWTAMVTLISGSCFREKHTYKDLHEGLHIFGGLSQADLPRILIFLICSH